MGFETGTNLRLYRRRRVCVYFVVVQTYRKWRFCKHNCTLALRRLRARVCNPIGKYVCIYTLVPLTVSIHRINTNVSVGTCQAMFGSDVCDYCVTRTPTFLSEFSKSDICVTCFTSTRQTKSFVYEFKLIEIIFIFAVVCVCVRMDRAVKRSRRSR